MPDEPPWPQENRDLLCGNWKEYGIETKTETRPVTRSETTVLGFPLARLVVLISCVTGAVLDVILGLYQGKKTGQHAFLRQIMKALSGEVRIADCYYSPYFLISCSWRT